MENRDLALVTGGGGFIGSHLVERLLGEGYRVRVLDNWSSGRRENLAPWPGEFEVVEGDVCDPATVRRAVRGARWVFHLAALASVPLSFERPAEFAQVNVGGTVTLLKASADEGVERFVYASSSSCYGASSEPPQREDLPAKPLSPYGLSKLVGEHYCRLFSESFNLETVSLRYFNVFGPRQEVRSHYASVVPAFVTALLDGQPPTLDGDGEQTRDFTYVENAVEATLLAARAPGASGEVFNVGSGERHSVRELFEKLSAIVGVRPEPRLGPPRPGDMRDTQADLSRARARLGYLPRVSFEEGLERTVRWFKEVREGK